MTFGAVDWFLRDEYWIIEGGRKRIILAGSDSQKGNKSV
jgi:hypothetical protein